MGEKGLKRTQNPVGPGSVSVRFRPPAPKNRECKQGPTTSVAIFLPPGAAQSISQFLFEGRDPFFQGGWVRKMKKGALIQMQILVRAEPVSCLPGWLLAVELRGEGFQAIQDILGADISFYSGFH